jgi:cytoskeletal protein CcmA (bactofilin family)
MDENRSGWTQRLLKRSPTDPELIPAPAPLPEEAPDVAVIDSSCSMEGRLVMDRPIRIEGEVRGTIVSSATVWVTESGTVEGDIRARCIEIRGAVMGNVTGTREVLVQAGGKLSGDVETASFVVERSAYFNGTTRMRLPQLSSRGAGESLSL